MKFEFEGIPSGDYECFCWAVDLETFVRITGEQPDEFDSSRFHEGLYQLYPDDLLRGVNRDQKVSIKIEIED